MDQRCGWETIEKKIRSWDCVCKMLKNVTIIIIIIKTTLQHISKINSKRRNQWDFYRAELGQQLRLIV